jgi:hypothetical protein
MLVQRCNSSRNVRWHEVASSSLTEWDRLSGTALCALVAGQSADALVITPTFANNITSDPNAVAIEGTINTAISTYEADFIDPINVAITFQEMANGLGAKLDHVL